MTSPGGAFLIGLSILAAGSGCTVTTYPEPARPPAARPPLAAPPAPARPRAAPAFRRAVSQYVRAAQGFQVGAPERAQVERIQVALFRLADAIEQVPMVDRRFLREAAEQIRGDAARVGFDGRFQADSREVRRALEGALDALEQLAPGRYGQAPGMRARVFEMRRSIEEIHALAPIRRQDAQIAAALDAAGDALLAMLRGLERGYVG